MSCDFTICVLVYGDHAPLARRCLSSILTLPRQQFKLRIGLNAASDETQAYVGELITQGDVASRACYFSDENVYKYPMMRRMFYDPDNPLDTPYVMWFDDDSYVITEQAHRPNPNRVRPWLDAVRAKIADADMIGSLYTMNLGGNQAAWVRDQNWYNQKAVADKRRVRFATGGWWTIRRELLEKHDWPPLALEHRGGDVMLGELCRQQDYRLEHFNHGVAINADEHGRESEADRRGFNQDPVGWHYEPGTAIQHAAVPEPPAAARERQGRTPPSSTFFNPGL